MSIPSAWSQYFPPRPEWSVDEMPDQTGKVILITGGTSGLGVQVLLARNATVYITSRDPDKGRQAADELRRVSEAIHVVLLDLSDLYSVRSAAHEFMDKEKHLHVLINNAGVMSPPMSLLTRQGYDLQFGVNVLGHFYLTQLLLPVLLETAKATAQKVRVLNYTASSGSTPPAPRIDYTTLMEGPVRRTLSPAQLHKQSKLGTLLLALELAERHGDQGVVSIAVNPGNVNTNLTRHSSGMATSIWDMLSYTVSKGILTPLYAATSPKAEHLNGKLLIPWARVGQIPPNLLERCAQETLWDWLEAQTECFDRIVQSPDDGGLRTHRGPSPEWPSQIYSSPSFSEVQLIAV
ncbi:NAD(P)-binding protein [Fomes fomentarius]|nr:NAD(P)-binding protein [Fomes fomentarius]